MRFGGEHGTWQLDSLPGCDQVCVSHSAFVLFDKRKQGFGTEYHSNRLEQMREMHYDCALATVDESNEFQKKILIEAGWQKVHSFKSSKTQHMVGIWVRDIL